MNRDEIITKIQNDINKFYKSYDSIGEDERELLSEIFDDVEKLRDVPLETVDAINNPKHYIIEGLEPYQGIDVVKSVLGKVGFKSFCIGNALKYIVRAEKKNGLEDYKKAKKYVEWIIEGAE